MTVSIIYKEWLKIRFYWAAAFVFNVILFLYLFIDIRHLFVLEPAQMVWYNAIHIGTLFYDAIKYLLPASGMLIGVAQFIPEINKGRLRLSLHLPVRLDLLVFLYVLIGLAFVVVIGVMDSILLCFVVKFFYPREVAASAIFTALPWFFSGIPAYLGTSMVILEPQWPRRIFYLVLFVGFVGLSYQSNYYNSYIHVIGKIVLVSTFLIPAVILPVYRFRKGR